MSSLLLVTGARAAERIGGRQQLAWLHRDALTTLLGDRLFIHELAPAGAMSHWATLRGNLDGLSPATISGIVARVREQRATQVFLDGSNLGLLAAALKRALPAVEVLTFCHNVEARFFLGALAARPSVKAAGVLVANYRAERLAVRHSDRLIALSERDGALLRRLYGRGATDILPMALKDMAPAHPPSVSGGGYLLFVGGAFYANLRGMQWYARHVAVRVSVPAVVIGRGMELIRAELEAAPGVRVLGSVDDLGPCYAAATAVIAPIFDGSGMKTKVAEALMFGKRVIGTPEAFSGYADDVVAANHCCTDADGFVQAIEVLAAAPPPAFDPALRALYERDHSPDALKRRLAAILKIEAPDVVSGG